MAVTKHPKTIAYLGMSLDGYIADTAEGMTWLEEIKGQGDNGYQTGLRDLSLSG